MSVAVLLGNMSSSLFAEVLPKYYELFTVCCSNIKLGEVLLLCLLGRIYMIKLFAILPIQDHITLDSGSRVALHPSGDSGSDQVFLFRFQVRCVLVTSSPDPRRCQVY